MGRILNVVVHRYITDGVGIEEPFGHNRRTHAVLSKFCGVAEFNLGIWGIPYETINLMTLKKYSTGKGNAKKPDMIAEALKRWPEFKGDDNAADALLIADWYRKEVFNKQ